MNFDLHLVCYKKLLIAIDIAGRLLKYACADMRAMGADTLYLITKHTSFYEKYGWTFLCEVKADGEEERLRMYIHKQNV